jgi:hypothetical protein
LWRLGDEDSSLWSIWDKPSAPESLQALALVLPGHDVDTEGEGDILRVTGLPQQGKRSVHGGYGRARPAQEAHHRRAHGCVSANYTIEQYGYHPNEVALSFDDGPDPKWTPRILDILKQKDVKGTFLMIGEDALENVG